MWKTEHALLIPRWKLQESLELPETHVMVVHLEHKFFEESYAMDYVEVYLLTEEGTIQSLIFMDNESESWLDQFYSYCKPCDIVV